jgi:hypothetical protein
LSFFFDICREFADSEEQLAFREELWGIITLEEGRAKWVTKGIGMT